MKFIAKLKNRSKLFYAGVFLALVLFIISLCYCIVAIVAANMFSDWDLSQGSIDKCSENIAESERTETLGEYIKLYSGVKETEFCLFNTGSGIGPTDWDYDVVIKVDKNEIPKWIEGYDDMQDVEILRLDSKEFYQNPSYSKRFKEEYVNDSKFQGSGQVTLIRKNLAETGAYVALFENGIILVKYYAY